MGQIVDPQGRIDVIRSISSRSLVLSRSESQRSINAQSGIRATWFWIAIDLGIFIAAFAGIEIELSTIFAYHFDFDEWSIHAATGLGAGGGATLGVGVGLSVCFGVSFALGMNGQGYAGLLGDGFKGIVGELERDSFQAVGLDGFGIDIGIGNDAWSKVQTSFTMLMEDAYHDPWKLVRCLSLNTTQDDGCEDMTGY